jgi:hypothetical protein
VEQGSCKVVSPELPPRPEAQFFITQLHNEPARAFPVRSADTRIGRYAKKADDGAAEIVSLVLHASRRRIFRKMVLGLAGIVTGVFLLRLGAPHWMAWIPVILGAGYTFFQLRSLGEEEERLVIDDSGIRDSLHPVGTIGWDQVLRAKVQKVGGRPPGRSSLGRHSAPSCRRSTSRWSEPRATRRRSPTRSTAAPRRRFKRDIGI